MSYQDTSILCCSPAVPEQPLLPPQSCWNEYLTTRIEQNLVLNCTCPIADCPAQPTGAFIRAIVSSPDVISKVAPLLWEAAVCSQRGRPQGVD